METRILIFGQLTDIFAKQELQVHDAKDTDALITLLTKDYPMLAHSKYAIAIDRKIVKGNTPLSGENVVALLPPFSGG